ncbi:MAG: N-acetylglucosamine-6-phosphate deacetylase, partial [Alphaproteobacteria bacterium]
LLIVPGFVDLHVPGGGGADALAGAEAVRICAHCHARHGTTAFLPTPVTAPPDDLRTAVDGIAAVAADRRTGEARVLGAHLEGPYLTPERLGAQPPYPQAPDIAEIEDLCGRVDVRLVTLAPEIDADHAMTRYLASHGVAVQIGHSAATYEETCAAMAHGARGFTHLFNAMTPLHHRAPGVVGAALAHAEYAALIPDLVHVHAGAILAAHRAIPRLFCVTDATAAAGMPDGDYPLGRHTVHKKGASVFLDDGTLAGSALTMDQGLRNLVAAGIDLAAAIRCLSTYPADFIGASDRGRIAEGAMADLVALDRDLDIVAVFVEGEAIDLAV